MKDFEKLGAFYLGKRYDTEADRLTEVVRQDLSNIRHAVLARGLHPPPDLLVTCRPIGAGETPVGDVTNECMGEGPLVLTLDRRLLDRANEITLGKTSKRHPDVVS